MINDPILNLIKERKSEQKINFHGAELIVRSITFTDLFSDDEVYRYIIQTLTLIHDGEKPEIIINKMFDNFPRITYRIINMSTGLPEEILEDMASIKDVLEIALYILEVSLPSKEELDLQSERMGRVSGSVNKLMERFNNITKRDKESKEKEKIDDEIKVLFNPDMEFKNDESNF